MTHGVIASSLHHKTRPAVLLKGKLSGQYSVHALLDEEAQQQMSLACHDLLKAVSFID